MNVFSSSTGRRLRISKKLLFSGVLLVIVVVLSVARFWPNENKEVAIAGIGKITAPTERKVAINKTLYNVLQNNLPSNKRVAVKDAVVRDKSYIDNYDRLTDLHHASFIVDMQSIQQSYLVYYEWSKDRHNPNLSGYPVMIQCLPESMLRYGAFDCQPMNTSDTNTTPDIINRYLPYHAPTKYDIREATTKGNGTISLTIDAYMPGWMSEMTPELLAGYTTEIQSWIRSKGLDPSKYSLEYVY